MLHPIFGNTPPGASGTPSGAAETIPAGTVMLFYQETVPVGWTRVTTAAIDNHAIKLDTQTALGSFTGSNGTNSFTAVLGASGLASQSTAPLAPTHSHVQQYDSVSGPSSSLVSMEQEDTGGTESSAPNANGTSNGVALSTANNTGGGSAHTHDMDLDINYVNVFLASKD